MKIELDLYSPDELDAFAVFCTSVAANSRTRMKSDVDRFGVGGLVGGLNVESAEFWRNHANNTHTGDVSAEPEHTNPAHIADELVAAVAGTTDAPKRERGKPSPGHKRRTNAEIAEDEAAAATDAARGTVEDTFRSADEPIAAISTGEERVGPEDTVEDQAQDAADEAAETAAILNQRVALGGAAVTLDDVRNVLGLYVKGYGLAAAQEDGPKLITEVCGDGKVKVSDIPDDKIADVIAAVKAAGKANRFSRTAVTN